MKKFEVHYELVFEKYNNAVPGRMDVKLGEEMTDEEGNIYTVNNEEDAEQYVYDFYYHNMESDMVDLPKQYDGDTHLEVLKVKRLF